CPDVETLQVDCDRRRRFSAIRPYARNVSRLHARNRPFFRTARPRCANLRASLYSFEYDLSDLFPISNELSFPRSLRAVPKSPALSLRAFRAIPDRLRAEGPAARSRAVSARVRLHRSRSADCRSLCEAVKPPRRSDLSLCRAGIYLQYSDAKA